jgi:hypothetical protein
MAAPKPVHTRTVCSVCGMEWAAHKTKTVEECVRLLKLELVKRPKFQQIAGTAGGYATAWPITGTGGTGG